MRNVPTMVGIIVAGGLWGCASASASRPASPSLPCVPPPPRRANTPSIVVVDTVVAGSRVYLDTEIDCIPVRIPGRHPAYPVDLRASNIEGRVEIRMVVDAAGSVELPTIQFVQSTHPAFTDAVRDILPTMRFKPAERSGQPVRTWVQMSFEFRVGSPDLMLTTSGRR